MFKKHIVTLSLLAISSTSLAGVKVLERYEKGDVNEVLHPIIHSLVVIDENGKAKLQDDPSTSWIDEAQAKIEDRDKTIRVGSHLYHLFTNNPYNKAANMKPTEDGVVQLDGKSVAEKIVQVRVSRTPNDAVRANAEVVKIDPQTRKLVSLTECQDDTVGAFQYGTVTKKLCITYSKDYCAYQKQTEMDINKFAAGTEVKDSNSPEGKAVFAKLDEALIAFIDRSMSLVDSDALDRISSAVEKVKGVHNPQFSRAAVVTGGPLTGVAQSIGAQLNIYGPKTGYENVMARAYVFRIIGERCDRLLERELF